MAKKGKKNKKDKKKKKKVEPEDTSDVPALYLESLLTRIDEDDFILSHLALRYSVGPDFCDKLVAPLRNNTKLCAIDLAGNALGLSGATSLAAAISTNVSGSITALNLRGCGIGADGLNEILAAMKQPTTNVTTLLLWGNGVGDAGASAIAAFLTDAQFRPAPTKIPGRPGTHQSTTTGTCSLAEVDLRGNHVTDVGAMALAQALQVNPTLTSLGLKANSIRYSTRTHKP